MAGPSTANGHSAANGSSHAAAENGHGVGLEDVHVASAPMPESNGLSHEDLHSDMGRSRQADEESLHESLSDANIHRFIGNITSADDFTTAAAPPRPPPALAAPLPDHSHDHLKPKEGGPDLEAEFQHLDHRQSRIYDDFNADPEHQVGGHVEEQQAQVMDEAAEKGDPGYEHRQSTATAAGATHDQEHDMKSGDRLFRLPITEAETSMLQREALATEIARSWARFDSFFGIFVVGNGILVGIQTDHRKALSEDKWFAIENAFLAVFIIELFLRFGIAGWRKMIREGWCWFDIIIISISLADGLYLSKLKGETKEAIAPLLRGIRLFRLARLIRLFRLLKELWMLVQCLVMTMRLLFWAALLLAIVLYISGIVMKEMVSTNMDLSEQARLRYSNVPSSMFFLLQMSTFDSWHDLVNEVVSVMPVMYLFFLLFLCASGLGIMNLIVGIMSYSAIEVRKKDRNLTRITNAVRRHKALLEMRGNMLQKQPGMFGYKMMWTPKALQEELRSDPYSNLCLKAAGLTNGTVSTILNAMIIDPEQPHVIHVDFLIKSLSELNGDMVVRALDLLTVLTQVRRIQTDFVDTSSVLCKALRKMHKSLENSKVWEVGTPQEAQLQVAKLLWKMNLKGKELGVARPPEGAAPQLPPCHSVAKHQKTSSKSVTDDGGGGGGDDANSVDAMAEKVFGKFDVFFGMFVIANGILIGFQSNDEHAETENAFVWRMLDACFCFVFTLELVLRLLLFNQVFEEMDMRLWALVVPEGVFQKTKLQCVTICFETLPKFLRNPLAAFDFGIVMVSLIDNLVIVWLDTGMNMSFLLIIRFVRLLKVARITRTFKLCGELYLLVEGVMASMRTLWWTVVLLIILLYIVGIIMVELVGKVTDDPDLQFRWDTVDRSMFTLAQIATLDGWADLLWALSDNHPLILCGLLVFVMFASMGIMNIIVGIMCESAVGVTRQLDEKAEKVKQKAAAETIAEIRRYFVTRVSSDGENISRAQLHQNLAIPKIERQFRKARVVPEDVRTIFDRLHGWTKKPDDLINIDELLHSCLQFHQPLSIPAVVALKLHSGTVMMRCRERCAILRNLSEEMVKGAMVLDDRGFNEIKREDVHSLEELQAYLQQQEDDAAPAGILKAFKDHSDKEAERLLTQAKMAAPQLRHC